MNGTMVFVVSGSLMAWFPGDPSHVMCLREHESMTTPESLSWNSESSVVPAESLRGPSGMRTKTSFPFGMMKIIMGMTMGKEFF